MERLCKSLFRVISVLIKSVDQCLVEQSVTVRVKKLLYFAIFQLDILNRFLRHHITAGFKDASSILIILRRSYSLLVCLSADLVIWHSRDKYSVKHAPASRSALHKHPLRIIYPVKHISVRQNKFPRRRSLGNTFSHYAVS